MRSRHDPFKWPFSIALALALVVGAVFLVPETWVDWFFSPLDLEPEVDRTTVARWLEILPPPELEILKKEMEAPPRVKDREDPPPAAEDPGWWTRSWRVRTVAETHELVSPTRNDSVLVVYKALGLGQEMATLAKPDSVVSHRLMLLRLEDGFAFEELKPYLRSLGRAWHMTDKFSREADMYDEHLGSIIMVPD